MLFNILTDMNYFKCPSNELIIEKNYYRIYSRIGCSFLTEKWDESEWYDLVIVQHIRLNKKSISSKNLSPHWQWVHRDFEKGSLYPF